MLYQAAFDRRQFGNVVRWRAPGKQFHVRFQLISFSLQPLATLIHRRVFDCGGRLLTMALKGAVVE